MIRRLVLAALAAASLGFVTAAAEARTTAIGTLECRSHGGISLILSIRDYNCTFFADWGRAFNYRGRLTSLGFQAGVTRNEVLVWRVFAPTRRVDSAVLRGSYVGASAGVSLIVGLGANALVGGSNQTISLQPLSVQAQTGINFALAGTAFSLH